MPNIKSKMMKKVYCWKIKLKTLLFILILGVSKICLAGIAIDTIISPITQEGDYRLTIPSPPELNYKVTDYKVHLSFSIAEIYELGAEADFSDVQIKFKVGEPVLGNDYPIQLTNTQPEVLFIYDIINPPANFNELRIFIEEIVINTSNQNVRDYINENIQVKVSYSPLINVDVRENEESDILAPQIIQLDGGINIMKRVQTFSWDHVNTRDFPNYEFQLLHLYNLNSETSLDEDVITTQIDWSKALRIVTDNSDKNLTISIVEGSGYYIWRVRPIGNYYEGGVTDIRNYGAWSEAPADTKESEYQQINSSFANAYNCVFFFEEQEEDLNWIYSRVFTEDNKINESMVYANDLHQVRQTQKYLPSTKNTIVSQTIMDYSGRPSLQTMAVPVEGKLDTYKSNFATADKQLYTAIHFDDSTNAKNPSLIDSTAYFSYYSDLNTDKYIPSSNGYSYSRVLYENSPLGRVVEQTSPGRTHTFGEQSDGKGHTTRIIYSKPTDAELIRIFGDEAMSANSVLKTITIDANNTASISYTSTSGKVIATCLVYDGKDQQSLTDIDGYPDVSRNTITEVIDENFKTNNGFVSGRKISLATPSKLEIKYTLPTGEGEFGCARVNAECKYVVNFIIKKEGTDSIWRSPDIPLKGLSTPDTTWIPQEEEFSIGSYIILKQLRSEADKLNPEIYARVDESLDPVGNIADVITDWLDRVYSANDMYLFHSDVSNFARMVNAEEYDSIREFKFYLGEVVLLEEDYRLQKSEGVSTGLRLLTSPAYDSVGGIFPEMIVVEGGCCGPVLIPATLEPRIICYTADQLRENPELAPNFYGYLRTKLVEPLGDVLGISLDDKDPNLTNILYSYDSISLNKMIYYMLTDKYYTGPTIEVDGFKVKIDSTPIKEKDKEVQYTCWELWDCWKGVINSYIDIAANSYTDSLGSIDKGMEDDADARGEENGKDDQFDENSDQFSGFFFKMFMSRILSKRMKDFENIDENDPEDEGDPVGFEFRFMEQFLNCAGYRFAGIVEKSDTSETGYIGILGEDISKDLGYLHSDYFYDYQTNKTDSLFLPYIKNPMFAFKYFQYDNDLSIDKSPTIRWASAELAMCYDNYADTTIFYPPVCDHQCGSRTRFNWNAYERFMFYSTIKNLKDPEEEIIEEEPVGLDTTLKSIVRETFISMRSACETNCNDRRSAITEQVIETFEENCYILNGCPADENVVLDSDIRGIVNTLIDQCVSKCDTLFEIASSLPDSFPKVIYPECQQVTYDGLGWETVTSEPYPIVLPVDFMHEYNILENWELVFALDDASSKCNYEDDFSSTFMDSEWNIFDQDDWAGSQVYTDSNLVIITKGEDKLQSIYLFRDDIADNFNFSIRIDSFNTSSQKATAGFIVLGEENSLSDNFVKFGISSENKFYYATDTLSKSTFGTVSKYPCYLMIERVGNQFSGYYRYDTVSSWQSIGSLNVNIPYNPNLGLYVNSASNTSNATVVFDDFYGGKKYPNRLNGKNGWIGNSEPNYPVFDENGFPKTYSSSTSDSIEVQP